MNGSRVPSVRPAVAAGRAFPFELASGQLEILKWLAFVCMVISHAYRHVWHGTEGWPIELGRICFPIFALCVAIPLSKSSAARGSRLAFSLFGFAVLAQVIAQPMRDGAALNVLFLFLSAGAWLGVEGWETGRRWCVRLLSLVVAFLAEFSLPGLAVIVCLVRGLERSSRTHLVAAAVALVLLAVLEGSAWAFAVFFVVPAIAYTRVGVVQFRGLFPRLYVAQYAVFWLMRAVL